ncbi:hypothetical protein DL93DRAFT_2165554 [Clavulina sp. PMI_390]|nr:hypothetical protein DL93DRAFT_2165554 [Clavulina sp. PMI_390]
MPHVGKCLCGAVTITIKSTHTEQIACHCTDCQHTSGSTNSLNIVPKLEDVTFEGPVKEYGSKGGSGYTVVRKFCEVCGSSLSHGSEALEGAIAIHTGNFPEDFKTVPFAAEIFVKDKFTALPPVPGSGQKETS